MRPSPRDPEKDWTEFWEPIISRAHEEAQEERPNVAIESAGLSEAELDQIKRELSDYLFMIKAIPLVYDSVTGGRCTKQMTDPLTVISLAEERTQESINDMLVEVIQALRDDYNHGLGHIQQHGYVNPADFIAEFFGVNMPTKEDQ